MSRDRITQIRIRGLRVIEDLTLDLDGLLVLIGDNGSGKSTILEAFEILRLAAAPGSRFPDDPSRRFGPFEEWLRFGASELTLGVCVEGQGQRFECAAAKDPGGCRRGVRNPFSRRERREPDRRLLPGAREGAFSGETEAGRAGQASWEIGVVESRPPRAGAAGGSQLRPPGQESRRPPRSSLGSTGAPSCGFGNLNEAFFSSPPS